MNIKQGSLCFIMVMGTPIFLEVSTLALSHFLDYMSAPSTWSGKLGRGHFPSWRIECFWVLILNFKISIFLLVSTMLY